VGLFFNRTPRRVREAQEALQRGDRLLLLELQFTEGEDHNSRINEIAGVGWDLHTFNVITDQTSGDIRLWGIYLFRRP
jgi:hypothetical protein